MHIGVTVFLTDQGIDPATLAKAVEERGYSSLYLPEHTHLPVRESIPPSLVEGVELEHYQRSLDPIVALSVAATVTEQITLGTGVLLVAQHDPIILAKQVATLDHLSGGRVTIGVGYGWNRSEMSDHGVEFSTRRELVAEKLGLMQALWSEPEAEYHGQMLNLEPAVAWPKSIQQPRVRTLIGGGAGPKLFNAVANFADGWMPIGGAGLADSMAELRGAWNKAQRDSERPSVVPFGVLPDPGKLAHYKRLGCDEVVLRVKMGSQSDVISTLDAYTQYLKPATR